MSLYKESKQKQKHSSNESFPAVFQKEEAPKVCYITEPQCTQVFLKVHFGLWSQRLPVWTLGQWSSVKTPTMNMSSRYSWIWTPYALNHAIRTLTILVKSTRAWVKLKSDVCLPTMVMVYCLFIALLDMYTFTPETYPQTHMSLLKLLFLVVEFTHLWGYLGFSNTWTIMVTEIYLF